jgi:hypothetical protein
MWIWRMKSIRAELSHSIVVVANLVRLVGIDADAAWNSRKTDDFSRFPPGNACGGLTFYPNRGLASSERHGISDILPVTYSTRPIPVDPRSPPIRTTELSHKAVGTGCRLSDGNEDYCQYQKHFHFLLIIWWW